MRAVLLDRIPNLDIANKVDADRALNGVKVNDAGMIQALLDYGSYDAYFYIRESVDNHKAEGYRNGNRLYGLDLGSLESLRTNPPDELVLFTSSHHLAKYVPFRQFCGHTEWPICGLTHGLSSNTLIPSYAWNYFSAVESHDAIICTSRAGQSALSKIFSHLSMSHSIEGSRTPFPPRMPVIPLGIDSSSLSEFRGAVPASTKQGFVVLCIGRFTASHKADLRPLIAAFLRSDRLPSDSTLILAGDDTQGHIASSLDEFSRQFESSRSVVVMPNISGRAKAALLKSADVALCISDTYQETFGLSVLEAMAAGLPVIAPAWSGYRDIIQHERTGFLVKTGICPDNGYLNAVSMLLDPAHALGQRVLIDMQQLMEYLQVLSGDRALLTEMGLRGRERAETVFSWRSVIARYEDLWEQLLDKGKSLGRPTYDSQSGFMDYDTVFAEYAENRLSLDCTVHIRNRVDDLLTFLQAGKLFSSPPLAGFSDVVDLKILEVLSASPAIRLRELIKVIADQHHGPSIVATQVNRLAKYGVLELVPPLNELNETQELVDEIDTNSTLRPVGV